MNEIFFERQAWESTVKCLSHGNKRMAPAGFEPRPDHNQGAVIIRARCRLILHMDSHNIHIKMFNLNFFKNSMLL